MNYYEEVLCDYKIGNKISHVTTGNAFIMIKAFSLPGYEQSSASSDRVFRAVVLNLFMLRTSKISK